MPALALWLGVVLPVVPEFDRNENCGLNSIGSEGEAGGTACSASCLNEGRGWDLLWLLSRSWGHRSFSSLSVKELSPERALALHVELVRESLVWLWSLNKSCGWRLLEPGNCCAH